MDCLVLLGELVVSDLLYVIPTRPRLAKILVNKVWSICVAILD
jgi:hypothetical protein